MFNRPISDALPVQGVANGGALRADIAVSAPAGTVELPEQAVTSVAGAQSLPPDHQRLMQDTHVLGRIRTSVEGYHRSKEDLEALEKLRAKLTLGYKTIKDTDLIPPDLENDLAVVRVRADLVLGAADQMDTTPPMDTTPVADQLSAHPHAPSAKKHVLSRIEAALDRIDQLRDKLGETESDDFNQLLGLNALVTGLNAARTQLDDSSYSLSAASTTVDSILVNMRTAVVAHGRTSADVVRLVLSS